MAWDKKELETLYHHSNDSLYDNANSTYSKGEFDSWFESESPSDTYKSKDSDIEVHEERDVLKETAAKLTALNEAKISAQVENKPATHAIQQFSCENPQELTADLPKIKAEMNKQTMVSLQAFCNKKRIYIVSLITIGIFLTICFIASFFINPIYGIDYNLKSVLILGVYSSSLLALYFLGYYLIRNNQKKATKLFKQSLVQDELNKYITDLELKPEIYKFTIMPMGMMKVDDLLECPSPETVISKLHLGNASCNENYVNEWIRGIYKGMPFRFFETKLLCIIITSNGKNSQRHEINIFEGQGYIFKSVITMPFTIQYDYSNDENVDLTIENFEKIFSAGKIENEGNMPSLKSIDELTADEIEVFNIIESTEFKISLLKLAKIFEKYGNTLRQYGSDITYNWTIRLQNQNLFIMRKGPFNYFEIKLDDNLNSTLDIFSQEITEFVSVLDTMSSLALVSGKEDKTRP